MLRNLLDKTLQWTDSSEKRKKFRPLVTAVDHFLYEPLLNTKTRPHIRDCIDLKRWMMLVVLSLFPCIFIAIWNTGLQKLVYTSGNYELMQEYLKTSESFSAYFSFAFTENRYLEILKEGFLAFLPIVLISYIVGGAWEALFAIIRRHEINEGFLVSGILYALILPPTLPYWMIALGVSLGIVIGKEIFGGTGMNILNPALTCRCFLYFAFPAYMTGEVWAGTHSTKVSESLLAMNRQGALEGVDAVSQNTCLSVFNISRDIKRLHVDLIAANDLKWDVSSKNFIKKLLDNWNEMTDQSLVLGDMTKEQLQEFLTGSITQGGLGLSTDHFLAASKFTELKYGLGLFSDGNLFFGNILGSLGEVSKIACLLGAFFLLLTRIGSWRTMLSFSIGSYVTALLFELGSKWIGSFNGFLNPAIFDFPAYKQFLMGGLMFGLIFMATDPVSSPSMKKAKWIYGLLIGALVMVIRMINPAYPEGVMLAILFGNVFAPLFDYYAVRFYRRRSG